MAKYSTSIEFIIKAKDDEKAQAIAERIASYVKDEKMSSEAHILDLELLDEDEEGTEPLSFDEDDE